MGGGGKEEEQPGFAMAAGSCDIRNVHLSCWC